MRNIYRMFRLLIVAAMLLLAACGSPELTDKGKNVSEAGWTVPEFTYTDQNGEPFGLSELKGKVWLADFIFTSCETVCPVLTAHMARLQDKFKEEGLSVPIVSFTVDPKTDTPEKLKAFGKKHGADFSTWHFLTGYSFEEIKHLSEQSFKSTISKPREGGNQFSHGVSFYLVKSDHIIKTYSGVSNVPYDAIVTDVKALAEK